MEYFADLRRDRALIHIDTAREYYMLRRVPPDATRPARSHNVAASAGRGPHRDTSVPCTVRSSAAQRHFLSLGSQDLSASLVMISSANEMTISRTAENSVGTVSRRCLRSQADQRCCAICG